MLAGNDNGSKDERKNKANKNLLIATVVTKTFLILRGEVNSRIYGMRHQHLIVMAAIMLSLFSRE